MPLPAVGAGIRAEMPGRGGVRDALSRQIDAVQSTYAGRFPFRLRHVSRRIPIRHAIRQSRPAGAGLLGLGPRTATGQLVGLLCDRRIQNVHWSVGCRQAKHVRRCGSRLLKQLRRRLGWRLQLLELEILHCALRRRLRIARIRVDECIAVLSCLRGGCSRRMGSSRRGRSRARYCRWAPAVRSLEGWSRRAMQWGAHCTVAHRSIANPAGVREGAAAGVGRDRVAHGQMRGDNDESSKGGNSRFGR